MTGPRIRLPESDLETDSEEIAEWIRDPTLQKILLVGYVLYEFYRLLLTVVATSAVFVVLLGVLSVAPLEQLDRLLEAELAAGGRTDAVFFFAGAAALCVIIGDIVLSRTRRSTLSYLCLLAVYHSLRGLFSAHRWLRPESDLNPAVLEVFSGELVERNTFYEVIVRGLLAEDEVEVKYHF